MKQSGGHKIIRGFTIVELLIVVVVIGILAAITIAVFSGVQAKARDAAMTANLRQVAQAARAQYTQDGSYPSTVSANNTAMTFSITSDASAGTFCITGYGNGYPTKNVTNDNRYGNGPCDGASGGPSYCPNDSYVVINGYYCDGTVGGIATNQNNAIKLLASDPEVPPGAPGAYVGRQTTRDTNGTITFTAAPGDVFCASGWAATVASTVTHSIGIQFVLSTGNSWQGAAITPASATGVWKKASGCFTAPANTTSAKFWTQNNGTNGTTADAAWYQTAISLTKQ